ncbi:MAG: ABC transporter permease [Pseudomonadales bacterium]
MTRLSLLAINLRRKPARSLLTVATLVIAFLLFMLLRGIAAAFAGGVAPQGAQRLYIDARFSMTDNLPIAYAGTIDRLSGVRSITPVVWFGGYYQQPQNAFAKLVVDPDQYFDVFPEVQVDAAVLERFRSSRRAVVVARSIADEFGWQPGERVPIIADITPTEDGGWGWEFELAGTYSLQPGSRLQPALLIRYDYFNESVAFWAKDQAYWMVARLEDGADPKAVANAIDGQFRNSSDPTRSRTEDDYLRQFARQLGDMGAITTLILVAVFFTIVLLTGNVTALSFRERVPELAVLKTLGFDDGYVARLVLGESVLLCLLGAALGIGLALLVAPLLESRLADVLGGFQLRWQDAAQALTIAVIIGTGIALPSARAAWRLTIVDALREAH